MKASVKMHGPTGLLHCWGPLPWCTRGMGATEPLLQGQGQHTQPLTACSWEGSWWPNWAGKEAAGPPCNKVQAMSHRVMIDYVMDLPRGWLAGWMLPHHHPTMKGGEGEGGEGHNTGKARGGAAHQQGEQEQVPPLPSPTACSLGLGACLFAGPCMFLDF